MLHTINGFACAAIGFALVDLFNETKEIKLSPLYLSLVAFCFSMTVGVLWEFIEYSNDHLLSADAQRDTVVTKFSTRYFDETGQTPIPIKDIDHTIIYLEDGSELIIEDGYLDIGITDTMKDLFVNFIGAISFSFIGYYYVKNRANKAFFSSIVPTREGVEHTIE